MAFSLGCRFDKNILYLHNTLRRACQTRNYNNLAFDYRYPAGPVNEIPKKRGHSL